MHLPAELIDLSHTLQGKRQAEGVRQILGQRDRLLASLEGLVRVAKIPQGQGRIVEGRRPRVLPVEEDMRAVLLGIVEGHHVLQVRSRRRKRSHEEQSKPQDPVGLQEEHGV